jgi:hypothetical protein
MPNYNVLKDTTFVTENITLVNQPIPINLLSLLYNGPINPPTGGFNDDWWA